MKIKGVMLVSESIPWYMTGHINEDVYSEK